MNMDARTFTGRGPKCEINMCRNRSILSVGDKGYKGGLGRTNICEECARQLKDLLAAHFDSVPAPAVETPEVETPEVETPEPRPEGSYVDMEREELMALAKSRGIKVSVTMKTETIIKELREHDAIS